MESIKLQTWTNREAAFRDPEPLIADLEGNGIDDLTEIWQISVWDYDVNRILCFNDHDHNLNGEPADGTIDEGVGYLEQRVEDGKLIVFHNGYEYDIPRAIQKLYDTPLTVFDTLDTLVMSRLSDPEREGGHALASWGRRFDYPKMEWDKWDRFYPEHVERCHTDVEITKKLWEKLRGMRNVMPKAFEIEHAMAEANYHMKKAGVAFDDEFAKELICEYTEEQTGIDLELQKIFKPELVGLPPAQRVKVYKIVNKRNPLYGKLDPGVEFCPLKVETFNPGSRQQVARRLLRKGWKPKVKTPSGQWKVSKDTLASASETLKEAAPLARWYKLQKRLSYLSGDQKKNGTGGGWIYHVKEDGRIRANFNPCGTVTGRPSCSSPNLQQVDTHPEMRACFIAALGREMTGVDLKGIELRCLGHYLHRYDQGDYGDTVVHGDPHTDMMRGLGMEYHPFVPEEEDEPAYKKWKKCRSKTKGCEYGWLYGAGDPKLGTIWVQAAQSADCEPNYAALDLDPNKKHKRPDVGRRVRIKMAETVPGLDKLERSVKGMAKRKGFIHAIDRRRIKIRSAHSSLNFLLQSCAGIIMKTAIAFMRQVFEAHGYTRGKHWDLVLFVHDEVQIEHDPGLHESMAMLMDHCVQLAGIYLGYRVPLGVDAKNGVNWSQTH